MNFSPEKSAFVFSSFIAFAIWLLLNDAGKERLEHDE